MFSKDDIKNIELGFRKLYTEHYSKEKLTIYWMIFPEGSAYSERRPSNATIIMVEVNDDIEKSKREEMMKLYSDFLANEYEVSPLDSIITVANSTWVDQFFMAQQNRVHPKYRLWFKLKTLTTALLSKWTSGFLRLRVKY